MEESRIIQCCPSDKTVLKCKCCCEGKCCSITYRVLKLVCNIFLLCFYISVFVCVLILLVIL